MTPIRLDVPAELTLPGAAALRESWLAALGDAAEGAPLELDLSGVGELDSAGVQLLLALRRSAAAESRELIVCGSSSPVQEALAVFGLEDWATLEGAAP